MIRIFMSVAFAALVLVVVLWQRREARIGPQEMRMKAGNVRVPASIGSPKLPRPKSAWALYLGLFLGGLILICFVIMKIVHGYDAIVLMDRGQSITANVTIDGMPKEDCHYEFSVNSGVYHGRGPERLDRGNTLRVLYDPISPRRNRPADGLWLDILTASAIALGALVILGVALTPRRRFRGHDATLAAQLRQELGAGAFSEAISTFRATDESQRHGSVLSLADGIAAACCAGGDQDMSESGQEAIPSLAEGESDPAIQRELVFYDQEIAASRKIWEQHRPSAGRVTL